HLRPDANRPSNGHAEIESTDPVPGDARSNMPQFISGFKNFSHFQLLSSILRGLVPSLFEGVDIAARKSLASLTCLTQRRLEAIQPSTTSGGHACRFLFAVPALSEDFQTWPRDCT